MPQRDANGPLNARDDLFNGPSAARNAVELGMAEAECKRALQEFTRELPGFCRRLDIPHQVLSLRTPELLMLICIRQQRIIDDLADTVQRLAFPHTEDTPA
jgi:hypothetical protein